MLRNARLIKWYTMRRAPEDPFQAALYAHLAAISLSIMSMKASLW